MSPDATASSFPINNLWCLAGSKPHSLHQSVKLRRIDFRFAVSSHRVEFFLLEALQCARQFRRPPVRLMNDCRDVERAFRECGLPSRRSSNLAR